MLHCSAHDIVFVAIWIIQKKKKKIIKEKDVAQKEE